MIRPLELVLKAFIKTYINLMEKLFMFLWAWYSKRRNYQFWPLCNTFLHGKFANAGPFKKLGYCNCIGLWPLRKIIFVYCTNCLETLIFRFCCDFRQKRIFFFSLKYPFFLCTICLFFLLSIFSLLSYQVPCKKNCTSKLENSFKFLFDWSVPMPTEDWCAY